MMNFWKKTIALCVLCMLCLFTLTGCKSEDNSIENLAYVVALGIDKGDHDLLKLSFQFVKPSSESNGASVAGSETTVTTVECSSINSGFNLMNSYISKKLNLSHCKIVVFSEELAAIGIAEEVQTLINKIQIRPDSTMIVSKCAASYFLENSKPNLTTLITRYYEVIVNSGNYIGYYYNSTLQDFFSALEENMIEPSTILGSLNSDNVHKFDTNSNYIDVDNNSLAGESLIHDPNMVQLMGTAVFQDGKLVGELNGIETISHLIVNGKLRQCILNIPDPFNTDNLISVSIYLDGTKTKLESIHESPYITVEAKLKSYILTYSDQSNYGTEEALRTIEKYINSYLETHIQEYLYKTAKQYHTDIDGFGKKMISKYRNIPQWNQSDWLKNYRNSFFEVHVYTDLEGSTLLINN